jgi:hypothetical protein
MLDGQHLSVRRIFATLQRAQGRHAAHIRLQPVVQELSQDGHFLCDALIGALSQPGVLTQPKRLSPNLVRSGDIALIIILFASLRDGATDIASDNIHHDGGPVLTSVVICGYYHARYLLGDAWCAGC